MTNGLAERVEREKAAYDRGLQRGGCHALHSHVPHYYKARRHQILRETFNNAPEQNFLDFRSFAWVDWIEGNDIQPKSLTCINTSQTEIDKGQQHTALTRMQPKFKRMDALHPDFADGTFDVVFGADILHHQQMPNLLDEIARLLKPGARAAFSEFARHQPSRYDRTGDDPVGASSGRAAFPATRATGTSRALRLHLPFRAVFQRSRRAYLALFGQNAGKYPYAAGV